MPPLKLTPQERFVRLLKNSNIPSRHDPDYSKAIRQRHAAILGICALVESYPYTIEKWMPELLTSVLVEHTYDPVRLIHIDGWPYSWESDPYIYNRSKVCK